MPLVTAGLHKPFPGVAVLKVVDTQQRNADINANVVRIDPQSTALPLRVEGIGKAVAAIYRITEPGEHLA
jgi:hypothetical protein